MHPPREGKKLLVLDLDHTLLDFSDRDDHRDNEIVFNRPYMNDFLACVYKHYDIVMWSQTSWRWLEIKLIELGMLADQRYRISFVLDKTSMFHVISQKSNGSDFKHQVGTCFVIL